MVAIHILFTDMLHKLIKGALAVQRHELSEFLLDERLELSVLPMMRKHNPVGEGFEFCKLDLLIHVPVQAVKVVKEKL